MSLKLIQKLICVVIATVMMGSWAFGQRTPLRASKPADIFSSPLFLYESFVFMSPDDSTLARLTVYTAFANDILQFIKGRQGNFTATYDLQVRVLDKKGNVIAEKSTGSRKISVANFEATNDQELTNRSQIAFDVIPGDYKLTIDLTDYDTQKSLHREKMIQVKTLGITRLSLSEILFAQRVIKDSLNQIIELIPNLEHHDEHADSSFWAYWEIYPIMSPDSVQLNFTIFDGMERVIVHGGETLFPQRRIIPYQLDIKKLINQPGRYVVFVQVKQRDKELSTRGRFSANWKQYNLAKSNIRMAIEALKEFIPDNEFRSLERLPANEQQGWLNQFWKQRDPTPGTDRNELQEEFYRRVDFVNQHFTVNSIDKEGWKTDRGGIYIKYGPPTDVERHNEQLNLPPFEIWYYAHLQRRFIFEDKSGVGDFQLARIE